MSYIHNYNLHVFYCRGFFCSYDSSGGGCGLMPINNYSSSNTEPFCSLDKIDIGFCYFHGNNTTHHHYSFLLLLLLASSSLILNSPFNLPPPPKNKTKDEAGLLGCTFWKNNVLQGQSIPFPSRDRDVLYAAVSVKGFRQTVACVSFPLRSDRRTVRLI